MIERTLISFAIVSLAFTSACAAAEVGDDTVGTTDQAIVLPDTNVEFGQCAVEWSTTNGTCNLGEGGKYLAFGSQGRFVYKYFPSGIVPCTRDSFDGADPNPGVGKICYSANLSRVATQGASFTPNSFGVSGQVGVAYGGNGKFAFATLNASTNYTCNSATFGSTPNPGGPNDCYQELAGYRRIAAEGQPVSLNAYSAIAYGANGSYLFTHASGSFTCSNTMTGTFIDPMPGVVKACLVLTTYDPSGNSPMKVPQGGWFWVGPGFAQFTNGYTGNVARRWFDTYEARYCDPSAFGGIDVVPNNNAEYCSVYQYATEFSR